MTSSVALTSKRSQNQSTAISEDAIVSNMKSCRSCRVCGEERSVLFSMTLIYTGSGTCVGLVDSWSTGQAADSVSVTFLQKFGVVVFNLSDEFLFRILVKMI